jgi:hypothetical protein
MHAPYLRAATQSGDGLARVHQAVRIEGLLEPEELLELRFIELTAHGIEFLHAHTVLPGDGTAHGHAQGQDLRAQGLCPGQLSLPARIIENQRMQVAVAGMEHVGNCQSVLLGQGGNVIQYLCQPGSRDGAVHAVVIRRQPPYRREGRLAAEP